MPTLHLQVNAGFANRVRAMISAISAAESLNIPLVIHWSPTSPECAAKFQSLVDPESLPKWCKVVPESLVDAKQVLSREDWNNVYQSWNKTTDLYMKSHGIFYRNEHWETHLRNIRPSRLVKDFLDRRCASVEWSTAIGIHIRRTDNLKSIQMSPLESFMKQMREIPESTFVVATDEQEVKDKLIDEFGDRCVFPALVYSRKSEEGMIQGVADFFALSKCSKIIGSYWSSFSEVAAWYGNSSLELATA